MLNLIRTDMKRLLKDKLLWIAAVIGVVFAVTTPLLYKLLFDLLDMGDLLGFMISAKSMYFDAYNPANNFGMIAPIFITVIICKDFSYGTIRNKIIAGYTRRSIYFSILISSAAVFTVMMLAQALLTLAVSLPIFEYQDGGFELIDLGYFLLSTLFELLVSVAIAAMMCFIAVMTRNTGLAILAYFAANFILTIIGGITAVAVQLSDPGSGTVYEVVKFLNDINIFTSTSIGRGVEYQLYDIFVILLPSVGATVALTIVGNDIFSRKDLK